MGFTPEYFKSIKSKADFIGFLSLLEKDYNNKQQEWENQTIPHYLESIGAWAEDYSGDDVNWDNPDWSLVALLFYVGKIYE